MIAIRLRTDQMENPLGLQNRRPLLSWNCEGGIVQTAYEAAAFSDGRQIWSSGRQESGKMQVRYSGEAVSGQRIVWKVRLWDEKGEVSDWSRDAFFEMGLLSEEDWEAVWIEPEPEEVGGQKERSEREKGPSQRYPASYLRKIFTVKETENARLYITCHGLYVAYINGERVGDFVLAPGTDDYRKRLTCQTYDVSDLLRPGENEIRIILGDGWYRGCNGIDGVRNLFGTRLALLCQLHVEGSAVLVSDGTWEASQSGPIRENDMEQGEHCDARLEDITDWHKVWETDEDFRVLVGSDSVPILEQERFPGKFLRTPAGETVIDFGQNLAGYVEFSLRAHAGEKIVLWHGETLDENGNFTNRNFDPGKRNREGGIPQKIEYICKEGENVYKPSFCIFGFRYVKVETEADLSEAKFTSIAVYSRMEQTGSFHCSDEEVNRLFSNSSWSMKSNFCDIPTDCPTRERAGWTGDAGVFAPTAVLLADCYPVFRKWLGACRLAQRADGKMANIAPPNDSDNPVAEFLNGSAGWGDACILVPWALYQACGDEGILRENYGMMKKWLRFVAKRAERNSFHSLFRKNPYRRYTVDTGFHWGEWCEPDVDMAAWVRDALKGGMEDVATAYFCYSAGLLAKIAKILGETSDTEQCERICAQARKAFQAVAVRNGKLRSNRQCAYVRALAFGLLEEADRKEAAKTLNDLVEENHYHLNTGFLSTPYLCDVLAEYGYVETAYRLLLQRECPGWLYEVRRGATTIWERWDGVRLDGTVHDSLNHYAYGAIAGWLISGVCGIRLEAGKLTIKPIPHPLLEHASARWKSPYGEIQSAWRYEEKTLKLSVTVPPNLEAEIVLPDGRVERKPAGVWEYTVEGMAEETV